MGTPKPDLLSIDDAHGLGPVSVADLVTQHVSPGQLRLLQVLGFHRILVDRAEGIYYIDRSGRRILDFFGAFGALAFGHNHPRILAARQAFSNGHRHDLALAFMSQYAAVLSCNLARIAPEDLDMVYLCSSGSEAVEAALKLGERVAGLSRATIVYTHHSFHGKTRGALSVTDSPFYQAEFHLLENRRPVPFGDAAALEATLRSDPSIGVFIAETVQGGAGIILPPPGYFNQVRRLCTEYGVVWIADEVQCGYGRTGRFFAFEHEEVVPDVVTLAKSLGGGKAAIGAYIARRPLYIKAYGTPKTALIHGPSTFSGMGETCITAIEALHTLYDEQLIDNAAEQGAYLLDRLRTVQAKHPRLVTDVRGIGCMIGLELADIEHLAPRHLRSVAHLLERPLEGMLAGIVGALLLQDYDILVAFTEYNRNVIRLEPPLIVTRAHIDTFVASLDDLLSRGIPRLLRDYVAVLTTGHLASRH